MEVYSFERSQELYQKAQRIVPNGIYGHYGLAVSGPECPLYFSDSKGTTIWDVDGNPFIDYMCGYGPMILGYRNAVVDEAVRKQYEKGDTVSLVSPVMVELAETLVDMVSIADWAFFAKNGGDGTNLSTMVAKAATGRKKIVKVNGGYHGVAPWMQDVGNAGVLEEDLAHILTIDWNDYDRFEELVAQHPGEIAGFISSPYHHPVFEDNVLPADGFWQKVETLCRKEGIVLIVDDVRAGFRIDIHGSNESLGFKPDLICLGKALGNGYPVSALVGTEALKDAVSSVFYTGTMFFGAAPMAAAVATLKELKRLDAARTMTDIGRKMTDGLVDVARGYGYELKVSGIPAMPYLRIANDDTLQIHADWIAECVKRGVYWLSYHNLFLSTAHTDDDLKRTWEIADDAFKAVKQKHGG
ncbi:MAG: aminotransferase class III-fold pyridoxal phosphate-dependent enzyme [Proteobacteria bacterium]|nr:aminotransferase class III-fold pyridoxal phosphate-dependent enzyme [Pseudomonadota bacterium]